MKECSRLAESMGLSDGIDNIEIHIEKFSMLCRILGKAFCMSRRQLIYHLQNMMYQSQSRMWSFVKNGMKAVCL